jgi:hypothetical protein
MLPLAPAYAISIHKSQGMSLGKVIVNIGHREFANGLTYTAINRCTKIENLAFYPLYSYIRFRSIFRSSIFKTREIYDKQVGTPTLPTAIPLKSSSSIRATLVFNLFFK